MRNKIDVIGFLLGWFAIIGQFVLMYQNRQTDAIEMTIRFFSFFTILTNLLVVLYFTSRISIFQKTHFSKLSNKEALTAITAFIMVIGIIYQFILRSTWKPTGFQMIINELLHSVIPVFVLLYWLKFANKNDLQFKNIKIWLWYPISYLIFIIIRGHFSNFYPYPFVDVSAIGYPQVLINSVIISIFFFFIMGSLIFIAKKTSKSELS